MKKLLFTFVTFLLFVSFSNAQVQLSEENPSVRIENKVYSIKEINDESSTISFVEYRNDKVWQTGEYIDNKLHGVWREYNENGEVISSVKYVKGIKIWHSIKLSDKCVLVNYKDNRLSSLIIEKDLSTLVLK